VSGAELLNAMRYERAAEFLADHRSGSDGTAYGEGLVDGYERAIDTLRAEARRIRKAEDEGPHFDNHPMRALGHP